jgi:hypothetical protein
MSRRRGRRIRFIRVRDPVSGECEQHLSATASCQVNTWRSEARRYNGSDECEDLG